MAQNKTLGVMNIIGNGTKLYAQNFFTLTIPVVLPVLGLFFGIVLMLLPLIFLPKFYPAWSEALPILREVIASIIVIIISLLPGLIVFKLAFWNYMLKIVSLNNVIGDILKRKVIKPHNHYLQVVALRTKDYLLMLGIWCSIILMGIALPIIVFYLNIEPLFMPYFLVGFEFLAIFLLIILSIYLSLSFQVFAFETSLGPMQTLEESFRLVLNNFWRIVTVLVVLTIITSVLVPQLFVFLADIFMLKNTISVPFQNLLENLFNTYNSAFTYLQILPIFDYDLQTQLAQDKFILELSKIFTSTIISALISLLMMPLGSCYYTLFYIDAKRRNMPRTEELKEEHLPQKLTKKTAKK